MDRATAVQRTIALGLGLAMLSALERGNLIIPCFTAFALGNGKLLKRTLPKWVAIAIAVNFKPYLIVSVIGSVLRGRWRWAEGVALSVIFVYVISYAAYGEGNPVVVIQHIIAFAERPTVFSTDAFAYTTTYKALFDIVREFPLMYFVGSAPIEAFEASVPIIRSLGAFGVIVCFGGVLLWRDALSAHRLAALGVILALTLSELGTYSEVFIVFLTFMEKGKGIGQKIALTVCYIISIPWDYSFISISHQLQFSYLSGKSVGYDIGLTIGQFVRPALLLVLEYGLVIASLSDFWRCAIVERRALMTRWSAPPLEPLPQGRE
jgi:hypothetical protein